MSIRGKRIPLFGPKPTIAPGEHSNLLLVPINEQLINGRLSNTGDWEARPGFESVLSTGAAGDIVALTEWQGGVAFSSDGRVFRATGRQWSGARELPGRLEGPYRPSITTHDGALLAVAGGQIVAVEGDRLRVLGSGKSGIPAPTVVDRRRGSVPSGTYAYRITLITPQGESLPGEYSNEVTVPVAGAGTLEVTLPRLSEELRRHVTHWRAYRRRVNSNEEGFVAEASIGQRRIEDRNESVTAPAPIEDSTGASSPRCRHLSVVGDYVVYTGHHKTQFGWSQAANHEAYPADNVSECRLDGGTIVTHRGLSRDLLVFKTNNLEILALTGGAQTFSPKYTVHVGCMAPESVVMVRKQFPCWLGPDYSFHRLNGGVAEEISAGLREEIIGLEHPEAIYGIDFPRERRVRWFAPHDGRCFTYDYIKGGFVEDRTWDGKRWRGLPIHCQSYQDGKVFVGMTGGRIGEWSQETFTDDGQPLRAVRRYSMMLDDRGREARVNAIGIRLERGTKDSSSIDNPSVRVRWAFDRGPWLGHHDIDLGQLGDTNPYDVWGPLGCGREMMVEIEKTCALPFRLSAGYVAAQPLGDGK